LALGRAQTQARGQARSPEKYRLDQCGVRRSRAAPGRIPGPQCRTPGAREPTSPAGSNGGSLWNAASGLACPCRRLERLVLTHERALDCPSDGKSHEPDGAYMWRLNQKSAEAIVAWLALLGCALPVTVLLPRSVRAEALPASVAACAAEHDVGKRLACYDREVARFAPAPPVAPASSAAAVPSAAPVPPAASAPPVAPVPPAAEVAAATAAAGAGESKVASGAQGATEQRHIAARIVSIERYPDEIVLHLDNGQIWQQVQAADADPNLHPGDAVTIDRSLGSYWLSGRSGTALKVKRRQ
jgi:hypothetical protein